MKMVVKIQIIALIIQYSIAQYNGMIGYAHNYPEHGYDYRHSESEYYDRPKQQLRKLGRHRRKIYRINEERYPNRIRKHDKYRSYEDYGCKCSCRNCAKLKRCCIDQCSECQGQANLMYVPYPVPVVVDVPSIYPPAVTPAAVPTTSTTSTTTTTMTTTTVTSITSSTQPPYYNKPCASLAKCKEYDRRYYVRNNYQRLLPNRFEYNDVEIRPTIPIYDFNNVNKPMGQKNSPWLSKYGYSPYRNNLAIKFGSEIRNYG